MKIGNPFVRLIRNAGALQVTLDGEGQLLLSQFRKQPVGRLKTLEPVTQHDDQFRVQRQHVLSPMLR
ncbi:MAG TPA: hypothetical protein VHZ24_15675 [Pirellulales bacterium]|nr:hypothetical protein [Pirellulales bacterium]